MNHSVFVTDHSMSYRDIRTSHHLPPAKAIFEFSIRFILTIRFDDSVNMRSGTAKI